MCQCECRNYRTCKKDYNWIPSTCICENSKYLKSTSMARCDEIIIVINNVPTKKTIGTNVPSAASINCNSIFVYMFYFAHNFTSNHITTDNNYYLLSFCKTKRYNIKWKIVN